MNKLTNSYIICMPYSDKLECLGSGIYIKQTKKKVQYMGIYVNEIEKKLIYRKKLNGKLKQCVLGTYPDIKIDDALKKSIIIGQEWETEQNKAKSYTFSDIFHMMLDEKKYSAKLNTIENYEKRFRTKSFDALRNKEIDKIGKADIWKVIDQYSQRYESKKKVRTILSEVFKFAQKRGLVEKNITPSLSEISGKKSRIS